MTAAAARLWGAAWARAQTRVRPLPSLCRAAPQTMSRDRVRWAWHAERAAAPAPGVPCSSRATSPPTGPDAPRLDAARALACTSVHARASARRRCRASSGRLACGCVLRHAPTRALWALGTDRVRVCLDRLWARARVRPLVCALVPVPRTAGRAESISLGEVLSARAQPLAQVRPQRVWVWR